MTTYRLPNYKIKTTKDYYRIKIELKFPINLTTYFITKRNISVVNVKTPFICYDLRSARKYNDISLQKDLKKTKEWFSSSSTQMSQIFNRNMKLSQTSGYLWEMKTLLNVNMHIFFPKTYNNRIFPSFVLAKCICETETLKESKTLRVSSYNYGRCTL